MQSLNQRKMDQHWIEMIESDKARVRDLDIYPKLRSWAQDSQPKLILEIGCGQGACSDQIDLTKAQYIGVDSSVLLIERAQSLYASERRKFIQGSAYPLPCADHFFDAVFSIAVWHLLEDINLAALELARVLSAGGHFMIILANPASYHLWTAQYQQSKKTGIRYEGIVRLPDGSEFSEVLYLHSRESVLSSLSQAGLKIDQIEEFRSPPSDLTIKMNLLICGKK
jgi:ubiquinone/menaquinone biosynthesis C-methylase UbiE